jgi:hypothetical protein
VKISYLTASRIQKMSQNGEEAKAPQAQPAQQLQNLNQTTVITFVDINGTIYIVSIVDPADPKNYFLGNGICGIIPDNHVTRAGLKKTQKENKKQYTLRFENGKWNVYLGETRVHTFDEIFGLPDGTSHLENVSFRQFKYVPTAVDEETESFRQILAQIVSSHPDRFCLEDPKKQMEVCEGGTKVRIPQPIFDLIKQLLIRFGVSTCSFVEHLENGSENGDCRGDMDLYVLDAKQKDLIIDILTKLGFVKDSTDKSNENTFRLYLDVLCQIFFDEVIIPSFNLPQCSDPAQYYIEVEIKIATEFQKAYESNCLGYFLGLLLSLYFKISISGVWLKHGCGEIPLNVASFDDFLKKLRINLDGIRTTEEFIERLLASPLISELLTVDNILRLYKNIMGDEKMKHTSKPLREWLHFLLCGLKKRFPDQFSSLRSELVQERVIDERNSQMIPVWRVRLFVLNKDSEFEIQMKKGVLSVSVSGKELFVLTGADKMILIFSENQLKSGSGKQALPESMKVCSRLFELFKDYFDYLKEINTVDQIIERFVDALECRSKVGSHLGKLGLELMKKICEELMKPLYSVIRTQPASMSGPVYGKMMKEFRPVVIDFSQFEAFCVQSLSLTGDYKSFVVEMMNHQIFSDYSSRIDALSPDLSFEENKQKRGEIYDDAIRNIVKLCSELVEQWTLFHNSDENWRDEGIREFHIPSQTYPETSDSDLRPYYLGTSMFEGINVHVFMDGEFGQVFTMVIE